MARPDGSVVWEGESAATIWLMARFDTPMKIGEEKVIFMDSGAPETHELLVAKSEVLSQAACFITRLKGEVRVCASVSPRSQLIS
jgi:hypothetical protein